MRKRRRIAKLNNKMPPIAQRLSVSSIVAGPFVLAGVYGLSVDEFPLRGSLAVLLVGLILAGICIYMSLIGGIRPPTLVDGEQTLIMRRPTMSPAFVRMFLSVPLFVTAGYLLMFTGVLFVLPYVSFISALYFFLNGAMRYMRNLNILYTVTDQRVIQHYRFLWPNFRDIPVSGNMSISESRSLFEIVTGRGSVVIASGPGKRQVIRIEEIEDPGPVASAIRAGLGSLTPPISPPRT